MEVTLGSLYTTPQTEAGPPQGSDQAAQVLVQLRTETVQRMKMAQPVRTTCSTAACPQQKKGDAEVFFPPLISYKIRTVIGENLKTEGFLSSYVVINCFR